MIQVLGSKERQREPRPAPAEFGTAADFPAIRAPDEGETEKKPVEREWDRGNPQRRGRQRGQHRRRERANYEPRGYPVWRPCRGADPTLCGQGRPGRTLWQLRHRIISPLWRHRSGHPHRVCGTMTASTSFIHSSTPSNARPRYRPRQHHREGAHRQVHVDISINQPNGKFTIITFIPKNLYEQLRRVADLFFLTLVVLLLLMVFVFILCLCCSCRCGISPVSRS
ncbi:hypothetical protein BDZ89DRAFT_419570 [Hymenopellis radicata]|nr:hypothetical protein BDZ89DRAFT_419570 [Hymenopellis radicata]